MVGKMSLCTFLLLGVLHLVSSQRNFSSNEKYYKLPHFWTSTGFCPSGRITFDDISASLLSDEVQHSIKLIGALPNGAITHIRIHWLLELIQFVKFEEHGIPKYDFTQLDTFINNLDDAGLCVGFELMGNPGGVFSGGKGLGNGFLWEDLTFQVAKRYLNLLQKNKLLCWRFESWNEPDLHTYNVLNFTVDDYNTHLISLRRGLDAAGRTPLEDIYFKLRGPAGLFKSIAKHPLCWSILERCSRNMSICPIDVLTFHRKGHRDSGEVLDGGKELLQAIVSRFPQLIEMPVANDEADPISGWSVPRPFQADVRYAVALVSIIFDHWTAMLNSIEFRRFESLSHDNAFISYHPYEFSQRTLFAHFRMNLSNPVYSQFIQKPVYAALGMLGHLGVMATDVKTVKLKAGGDIRFVKSFSEKNSRISHSWVLLSDWNNSSTPRKIRFTMHIPMPGDETYAYISEILEHGRTDPAFVWKLYGRPPYPNATVRQAMRRCQTPDLHSIGIVQAPYLRLNVSLRKPWLMLLRVCSNRTGLASKPHSLQITQVTAGEILLTWKEKENVTTTNDDNRCLKTYEVWFCIDSKPSKWNKISSGWHVPFLSFHFAPENGQIFGFYKIRSVDVFNRHSKFSKRVEYKN